MNVNFRFAYYAFLAWITVAFVGQASAGESIETQRDPVDTYIQAEMANQKIPGFALLVSRAGKVIRTQGYGLANVELQVPVKPETIFQSGSVGKQFTATAIMILVEEGKIRLDDPLTRY